MIENPFSATEWLILFLGWLFYWLKKMHDISQSHKGKGISAQFEIFVQDNLWEVLSSFVACIALSFMTPAPPPGYVNAVWYAMVFLTGYASSSILNSIITKSKGNNGISTTN